MLSIERVGSLLCVAGPRASGKTTFVHQLKRDEDSLPSGLPPELHAMKGWNARTHARLRRETRTTFKTLIAHYDLSHWTKDDEDKNLMSELLAVAEEASCVTLWAEPAELRRRIEERFALHGDSPPEEAVRSYRRTRAVYAAPEQLVTSFEAWFEVAGRFPLRNHWIIDTTTRDVRPLPVSAWPSLRERMLADAAKAGTDTDPPAPQAGCVQKGAPSPDPSEPVA